MGKSIRYKRGTIWFYKDNNEDSNTRAGFRSHVQSNARPVLIVSSDFGNSHSPVVNVVPLTTANKECSVNVPMETEDGVLNHILCNQIKTIDAKDLSHYISTVDDETMAKVDKTINCVLGISTPRIEKSLKDIETMIQNVVTMKFNDLSTRDEFDTIVENIAKGLENTYGNLMEQYINNLNSAEKRIKEQAPELAKASEIHNTKSEDISDEISEIIHEKRNGTRNTKPKGYWTLQRKYQYVSDFDSHDIEWIMKTYEIDTKEQAKRHYYQYKWQINKRKADTE